MEVANAMLIETDALSSFILFYLFRYKNLLIMHFVSYDEVVLF